MPALTATAPTIRPRSTLFIFRPSEPFAAPVVRPTVTCRAAQPLRKSPQLTASAYAFRGVRAELGDAAVYRLSAAQRRRRLAGGRDAPDVPDHESLKLDNYPTPSRLRGTGRQPQQR
jgi:hypothetical protein